MNSRTTILADESAGLDRVVPDADRVGPSPTTGWTIAHQISDPRPAAQRS